ncbi:hypothetical protein D3C81_935870 [compost metagenome]
MSIITDLQEEIAEKGREIARLHAEIEEWSGTAVQNGIEVDNLRAQLAAQQGVVMPERKEYPSRATYPDAREFDAACLEVHVWNTCLDKVARLNADRSAQGEKP